MKKIFKLLIISLLAASCALGLFACSATDNSDEPGIVCKKFSGDEFYTVIGYNAEKGEDGNDITYLDISAAAQEKYGENGAKTIIVGRIRTGAFDGNSTLKEVAVSDKAGDGVDLTIDEGAFRNMRSLEKITLPFVGANRYSDADYQATAPAQGKNLKATDKARSFGYIFGEEESDVSSPVTFTYGEKSDMTATFYIPVALSKVEINAEETTVIPMYAFCGLTRIYSVELKGNITAIGRAAFKNMAHLKSVNIPASVEIIYDSAFESTPSLKGALVIPANSRLKEIREAAFKGTAFTSIDLSGLTAATEDDALVIGNYAFYASSLTEFKFPAAVKSVGAYAFANSKDLTKTGVTNMPADNKLGVNAFADIKAAA